MARRKRLSRNSMLMLGLVAGAAVIGTVLLILNYQGLLTIGPGEEEATATAATSIQFNITDYATGENLDVSITRYRDKHTLLDSGDIQDLRYSDFASDASGDEDMDFTPDTDYNYWFHVNKTGFLCEWYYYYTSGSPASGMGAPLSLGVNYMYLMNITEAANLVVYNSTLGTNLADGYNATDFLPSWATTDQDFTIVTKVDYDESGSDTKAAEGLKTVYDFVNDWWNQTIIRIEYNTTADRTWARINDYTNYESVSGNTTYIGIDATLVATNSFELHFDSNMGSTYSIREIALCYGAYTGTPVVYSTQAA